VLLPRRRFAHQAKRFVSRGVDAANESGANSP
jgi:hypothetical protein